jgi:hypothetical protein
VCLTAESRIFIVFVSGFAKFDFGESRNRKKRCGRWAGNLEEFCIPLILIRVGGGSVFLSRSKIVTDQPEGY